MIGPSNLPWWGWVLCSAMAAGIAYGINVYDDDSEKGAGRLAIVFMIVSALLSVIFGIIAVIRFVKWVWTS
jgi:hypothetical protein